LIVGNNDSNYLVGSKYDGKLDLMLFNHLRYFH